MVNRTAVLWALNAMACSAIQASAPASKPSSASSTDLPPAAAALTPYATVTDERLQHPEAGDWLMYRRTYDGSGFSPLSQINAKNIANLSLALISFRLRARVRLEKSNIVTLRGSQNKAASTWVSLKVRAKTVMLIRPSFFNIPWHSFCP